MSTEIYNDTCGRVITQFCGPRVKGTESRLMLEIWAEPWKLTPDEARRIGLAIFTWAIEHDDGRGVDYARGKP